MKITPIHLILLGTVTVLFPAFSYAQDTACLMEGSFTLMGQTTEVKDCIKNNGMPHEQFIEMCQSISNTATAMGAPAPKITYKMNCNANEQASCESPFHAPVTFYYYKRDAESLANAKKGCSLQQGKWHEEAQIKR